MVLDSVEDYKKLKFDAVASGPSDKRSLNA